MQTVSITIDVPEEIVRKLQDVSQKSGISEHELIIASVEFVTDNAHQNMMRKILRIVSMWRFTSVLDNFPTARKPRKNADDKSE